MLLIEARRISKIYLQGGLFGSGRILALREVSLQIEEGERAGLVGESGAGKSTLARILLLLERPTEGEVLFRGRDTRSFKKGDLLEFRRAIQGVFQNPQSSLNPRMKVKDALAEPLKLLLNAPSSEIESRMKEMLEAMRLGEELLERFPHELSEGESRRIALARALIVRPLFLILDEPTSGVDSLTQSQILDLLSTLGERRGLGWLFISHDLRVTLFMCRKIFVMYRGFIVESAQKEELLQRPLHPYSQLLLRAAFRRESPRISSLSGEFEERTCPFLPLCPSPLPPCSERAPELSEVERGHFVACFRYGS